MKENSDLQNTNVSVSAKKTSRLAIIAFVCSLIGVISLALSFWGMSVNNREIEAFFTIPLEMFSHIAFVLGIIAIVMIAFNRKKLKGKWYAILAIFLSLPFVFLTASAIIVNRTRTEGAKTGSGQYIGKVLIKYAKDRNGYLPDANQWCNLLVEYDPNLSKDDFKYESSEYGVCNYAFNRNLSGAQLDNISYNTVLVFESEGKLNLSGTEELFKKTPKKRQYVYVYTKDIEIGYTSWPRAIRTKDADYEQVLWKLSYRK